MLLHGHQNSSFWILSINDQEFITAKATVTYIKSLQKPATTSYVPCILACCQASQHTSYEGDRDLFNQVRLAIPHNPTSPVRNPTPIIVPSGFKIVSSPTRPPTPAHFGQTLHMPFSAAWKEALFANYSKMLASGTFAAPILCTTMPPDKTILRS